MSKTKLEIGLMKNQGRLMKPQFETIFKKKFPEQKLEYIGFEASLDILDKVKELQIEPKIQTGRMNEDRFNNLLKQFITLTSNDDIYLFFYHYTNVGAIIFKLHDFLNHGIQLIKIDGDAVSAINTNLAGGILLDFDDNSRLEDWGYEAFMWGSWKDKYIEKL